jgi:predicted AlkP superfamily phosphohydrolase/phosphomutase
MKKGTVKNEDVDYYLELIIEKLKQLQNPDTGEILKVQVYKPEEVYNGEFLDEAPDIIFMIEDGTIEIDATVEDGEIFAEGSPFTGWTGTHTPDGVLIANGPLIKQGQILPDANIMDITPTILHIYGIPVPGDVDGKTLYNLFSNSASFDERSEETASLDDEGEVQTLSDAEKALIEERLRKLGYLS